MVMRKTRMEDHAAALIIGLKKGTEYNKLNFIDCRNLPTYLI